MIANAFGGNIIEYDAQWFIDNLDLSNYDYVGYIGYNNVTYATITTMNINSNYRYLLIWDGNMELYGENSSNKKIFTYTPFKTASRTDPYILNIKFSSDIVKITSNSSTDGYCVSVYKEK